MLTDGYSAITICVFLVLQQVTLMATSSAHRGYVDQYYDKNQDRFNDAVGNNQLNHGVATNYKSYMSEDNGVLTDTRKNSVWEGNRHGSTVDKYYSDGNRLSDIVERASAVLSGDERKAAPQAFLVIPVPSDQSDVQSYSQPKAESYDPPGDPLLGLMLHSQGIGTLPKTEDEKFKVYPDTYNDWAEIERSPANRDDSQTDYLKPIFRKKEELAMEVMGWYGNDPNPSWNRPKRDTVDQKDSTEALSKLAKLFDKTKFNKENGTPRKGIKNVVKPALDFLKETFKNRLSPENSAQETSLEELTPKDNDIVIQPIKEGGDGDTMGGAPEGRPGRGWDLPFSVLDIDGVVDTQKVISEEQEVISTESPVINDIQFVTNILVPFGNYDAAVLDENSAADLSEEKHEELPVFEGFSHDLQDDGGSADEPEQAHDEGSLAELIESVFPPLADAVLKFSFIDERLTPPSAETNDQQKSSEILDNNNALLDDIAELLEFKTSQEVAESKPGGAPPHGLSPGGAPQHYGESWKKCLITPIFPIDNYHPTQYRVCITAETVEKQPEGSGSRRPPTILEDIIFHLLAQADEPTRTAATQPRVFKRSADNRPNSVDYIERLSEAQN